MTARTPLPLQLGQDARGRQTLMPISMAHRRQVQSAKERASKPSVHHQRQVARITAGASSSKESILAHSNVASRRGSAGATRSYMGSTRFDENSSIAKSPVKYAGDRSFSQSIGIKQPLQPRPHSSGAFKARKIERTRFRYFYDRGDLPLRVNFAGAVRKIQWQVDVLQLDYMHYLPLFMEGLRELDEPYHFLALNGTLDLLEKGGQRTLTCIPLLVLPMKQNLMTRHHTVLCLQMKVLQKLVLCCPLAGEALVPYYRQLLSIFNLFITKRVNCGDAIDYGQRRQENLGDLILETLNTLERHGGPDAFVNIKYMIPTYESCMQKF